jgi:Putative Ig domain
MQWCGRYKNGAGFFVFCVLAAFGSFLLNGCAGIATSAPARTANSALAITSSALPSGTVQSTYQGQVTASGGLAPISWKVTGGALPSGLALNAATGTIGGTPSASGQAAFTVQVADSSMPAQTAAKNFSIAIGAATNALQVTTSALPGGQVNANYGATLAASGGTTPYVWSIPSGSLPAGLALSAAGQLSGTPTQSGTASFTAQVSDSSSPKQTASKSLSIAISAAATNPVQITTAALPGGLVSTNYLATLSASGGTAPYSWAVASGSLPAGLAISAAGQISGTPTQSGTVSFTVQVGDSSSPKQTASHAYSINIGTSTSGMPLTSCQVLANSGTTYVLQNDVSSRGSCFNIQANGITLNLNGHTITYADPASATVSVAPATSAVFGIYGAASYDPNFNGGIATGNSTGGSWNNLTVAGPGTITQGSCLSPSNDVIGSNAIHLGQGSGDGLTAFNITFNICADSAHAIFADANGGGDSIHDNIVNDKVVTAQKRSIYEGVAFVCDCAADSAGPSYFYNNTITGGPQGGIIWGQTGTVMYNNTIKHGNPNGSPGFLNGGTSGLVCGGANANPYSNLAGTTPGGAGTQCTNDFGLFNQAANAVVYGNKIQALEGRGISISGTCWTPGSCTGLSGQTAHDDVVVAQEFPNNSEYQGCEIGGAWGLEWRDGPVNSTIYNENVTAISNQCQAGAFRTQYVSSYNDVSHNNTYAARRAPGSPSTCFGSTNSNYNCAYAAAFLGASDPSIPTQFTSRNDTFIADSALLFFDWDPSPNEGLLISPTFQKGTNPDPNYFHFAVFRNGASTVAMHIRDAIFGSGVSPTDTDLPAQGPNELAASLYIDWTLTLTVHNGSGNPVSGASVSYTNSVGKQECNTTTNASGVATCVVTQYRDNNDTGANQIESHNPFSFSISATGCTTLTGKEAITGTVSETKILPGC